MSSPPFAADSDAERLRRLRDQSRAPAVGQAAPPVPGAAADQAGREWWQASPSVSVGDSDGAIRAVTDRALSDGLLAVKNRIKGGTAGLNDLRSVRNEQPGVAAVGQLLGLTSLPDENHMDAAYQAYWEVLEHRKAGRMDEALASLERAWALANEATAGLTEYQEDSSNGARRGELVTKGIKTTADAVFSAASNRLPPPLGRMVSVAHGAAEQLADQAGGMMAGTRKQLDPKAIVLDAAISAGMGEATHHIGLPKGLTKRLEEFAKANPLTGRLGTFVGSDIVGNRIQGTVQSVVRALADPQSAVDQELLHEDGSIDKAKVGAFVKDLWTNPEAIVMDALGGVVGRGVSAHLPPSKAPPQQGETASGEHGRSENDDPDATAHDKPARHDEQATHDKPAGDEKTPVDHDKATLAVGSPLGSGADLEPPDNAPPSTARTERALKLVDDAQAAHDAATALRDEAQSKLDQLRLEQAAAASGSGANGEPRRLTKGERSARAKAQREVANARAGVRDAQQRLDKAMLEHGLATVHAIAAVEDLAANEPLIPGRLADVGEAESAFSKANEAVEVAHALPPGTPGRKAQIRAAAAARTEAQERLVTARGALKAVLDPVTRAKAVLERPMPLVQGDADPRTAGTGGIENITGSTDKDTGAKNTKIKSRVLPGMVDRAGSAPNYNRDPFWRKLRENHPWLAGWQAAHLHGPGAGDEAAAGMLLAPSDVNLVWQASIERHLRELRDAALPQGKTIVVEATSESHARDAIPNAKGLGASLLKSASYKAMIEGEPGSAFTVTVDVDGPPDWKGTVNVTLLGP